MAKKPATIEAGWVKELRRLEFAFIDGVYPGTIPAAFARIAVGTGALKKVLISGHDAAALENQRKMLQRLAPKTQILAAQCDYRVPYAVDQLASSALSFFAPKSAGLVALLAGLSAEDDMSSIPACLEQHQMLMQLNHSARVQIAERLIPGMQNAKRGFFLLLGSSQADANTPNMSGYGCSKAATHRYAETLARRLADYSIGTRLVVPGIVQVARMKPQLMDSYTEFLPGHRVADANSIANAMLVQLDPALRDSACRVDFDNLRGRMTPGPGPASVSTMDPAARGWALCHNADLPSSRAKP